MEKNMSQQFPIVLAHGIARFDELTEKLKEELNLPDDEFNEQFQYFKGIKPHLESHGFASVVHPRHDFAGSADFRAEQLKNSVEDVLAKTDADKVHIIAHSMGGLDARRMIVDKGMASKVASLTTIGTPHFGTILADHVINNGGIFLIRFLKDVINLDGFSDLTITACEQFNQRAEASEAENDVFYQTYASSEELNLMFLPLIPSWAFIRAHEGRNDGLVPFKSQQWKNELVSQNGKRKTVVQKEFPLPADHLNQVGWWDLEEAGVPLFYGSLIKQKDVYENQIKAIYLDIATNLWNLE